jgi:hypothetical protein
MQPERSLFLGELAWTRASLLAARDAADPGSRPSPPDVPSPLRRLLSDREAPWRRLAACRRMGSSSFVPSTDVRAEQEAAKEVCARCCVVLPCLAYAMTDASLQGVWGGTTPQERAQIRRSAA